MTVWAACGILHSREKDWGCGAAACTEIPVQSCGLPRVAPALQGVCRDKLLFRYTRHIPQV